MNLHPASRREILHITASSGALTLLLILVTGFVWGGDHRILIGALGGCVVATGNFAFMCLTIQKAVSIGDLKARQAFIQGSYSARLLLQALWVVMAFVLPHMNALAAAAPLLFPGLIIFLNRKMHKKTQ